MSTDDLAAQSGLDRSLIERIEAGILTPLPGDYVLMLARALNADFRSLISSILDEQEKRTGRLYRALGEPTPADRRAIRRFMNSAASEADLELLLERRSAPSPPEQPSTPQGMRYVDQGEQVARQERIRLELGDDPIPNIFELLRSQGLHVFRHRLDDSKVAGLTVIHPVAGICVLINYEDDLYRQFFSAAHEYAHAIFDRSALRESDLIISYRNYRREDLVELRADRFAAEFLLPRAALHRYPRPKNIRELTTFIELVARDYKVNAITVALRLKAENWISETTLESFKRTRAVVIPRAAKLDPDLPLTLTQRQRERRSRAFREGVSPRLLDLIRSGMVENKVSLGRVAEVLEMTTEDVRVFLAETGVAL